jgi:hypothetical protein
MLNATLSRDLNALHAVIKEQEKTISVLKINLTSRMQYIESSLDNRIQLLYANVSQQIMNLSKQEGPRGPPGHDGAKVSYSVAMICTVTYLHRCSIIQHLRCMYH